MENNLNFHYFFLLNINQEKGILYQVNDINKDHSSLISCLLTICTRNELSTISLIKVSAFMQCLAPE